MGNEDREWTYEDRDKWEYWEDKFKNMSEEEIKQYWANELAEAEDPAIGALMDAADDIPVGSRAAWVKQEYQRYLNAKKQHEANEREEER